MSTFLQNLKLKNKILFFIIISLLIISIAMLLILPKIKNTILDNSKKEMISNTTLTATMTASLFDSAIKNYLRAISETHLNTVTYQYNQYKAGTITKEEAISNSEKLLLAHKIGKSGYVTSVDISKGKENITLAIHPKAKGVKISKFPFVQEMYKRKTGYLAFKWKNPNEKKERLKVSYMSYFEPWKWILSAAPYKEELYSLVNLEDFRNNLHRTNINKNEHKFSLILDLNGDIVYHPTLSGKNILKAQDINSKKYFIKDLINECKLNANKSTKGWIDFKNKKIYKEGVYSTQRTMYYIYIPEYKWIISTIVDQDYILKPYKELQTSFIIVLFIMFLAILILTFLSTNYILSRIKNLEDASAKLLQNDYNIDIKRNSNDEIGDLEYAFSKAVYKINKLITKQNKLNNSLEYRITKEVEKNRLRELQLFESSKLSAMGDLIGNIAHQWRQPLSAISTGITGLQVQKECGVLTDDDFTKICTDINKSTQFLSKTIDNFRNFINSDSNKEKFILNENIDSFLYIVNSSIMENKIQIVLDTQEQIEINSYSNNLIQCYINIFNNAKDVLINQAEDKRFLSITLSSKDNQAIISFKDCGNGIEDDILPKIFEPYFTTKHQSQGVGLGLHMTHNLITDKMKGTFIAKNSTFIIENKQYKGAEFIITIPIS